ncbi:ferritin-like domain-containing protein [Terriglobus sp.]|uniref:ferritin-like domain-containing protein n=1 Tax=Terriglobus sp. TaxID=1889013 RepID=UPI003AFF750C
MDQLTKQIVNKALSRRGFLASAGVATAATLTGCGGGTTATVPVPTTPPATAVSDVDVLNFALNLEYLEAEYYLRAVTGAGIPAADQLSGAGAVTVKSGSKVTFTNNFTMQIAAELAQTELQHVRILQAAVKLLGGTPVAAPAIDLMNSFNAVASLAMIGSSFDPFANEINFFVGAATFEDVGVTAYTGAASLLTNATILSAAAGIQAAEAYHAATVRAIIAGTAAMTGSSTALSQFAAIQGVRASVGGGNETILTPGISSTGAVSASTIVAADSTNSLGFARTTDQVLHIVYGAPAGVVSKGGFFPSGVNGNIKATAA